MKITRVDQKGIDLITSFEGFRGRSYLCPANVPTVGFGTTRYPNGSKVSLSDREITKEEAISFLQYDVKNFELAVDAMAVDTLTQNQFNALVSFAYNLGSNALKGSTLLRKVNLNIWDSSIRNEFMKWTHAGGEVLEGLVKRRKAESELYFTI